MPDYMFLLESRLMPEQRATMMRVQELSAALGLNVYLTGGTVRDLITGATLRDLDFTVEGNPTKIARELEKGGGLATAGLFVECNRNIAEPGIARITVGPDERAFGHRARRGARADDS